MEDLQWREACARPASTRRRTHGAAQRDEESLVNSRRGERVEDLALRGDVLHAALEVEQPVLGVARHRAALRVGKRRGEPRAATHRCG